MTPPDLDRPLLVLDTASPAVSVAVGQPGGEVVHRVLEIRRTAELLLHTVDEVLAEVGCGLGDLGGVAALQGPGSFTGLRIGLATVLGWHQAVGLPATALPTLPILAAAGGARGPMGGALVDVVAAVDALRGDWLVARFPAAGGGGESRLVTGRQLLEAGPCRLVGFGVRRLAGEPWWDPRSGVELVEPPPLAPLGVAAAGAAEWDSDALVRPSYFRPPAVTLPPQDRRPAP